MTNDTEARGTRRSTRDVYRSLLGTIQKNTGDPQPEALPLSSLMIIQSAHGPDDPEAVRTALRAAQENDELVIFPDRDGRKRIALAGNDEALLEAIEVQVESADPDQRLIGRCNRLMEDSDAD